VAFDRAGRERDRVAGFVGLGPTWLAAAGVVAHLAEPAETANLRGRRQRAETDRADARYQREMLLAGRLAECWIPLTEVLEARVLLGCCHDLRRDHTRQDRSM
jgi:transposase